MSKEHLTTVSSQTGKVISVVGDTYRIVAGGEQTSNKYALIDMMIPKGGGPGPHAHKDVQEAFYIIDGEIEVTSDDGNYTASAGSFVNIPTGGLVHMFTNKQDKPAHILCILTPAGMEKMLEEMGKPVDLGEFLPKPEITPDMANKMKALAEKYGNELYPPDYFNK